MPSLLAELAMDDGFREVLFWSNSSDDNFNFILQAIKTRRNIKFWNKMDILKGQYCTTAKRQSRKIDPKMGKTDPDLKTLNSSRLVGKIDNITVLQSLSFLAILHWDFKGFYSRQINWITDRTPPKKTCSYHKKDTESVTEVALSCGDLGLPIDILHIIFLEGMREKIIWSA